MAKTSGTLSGKVAVITGATSGFGTAIARRFAQEGAALVLAGRDEPRASALLDELRAQGAAVDFVFGDVGDEETAEQLAARARARHGRIDALVLNAGSNEAGNADFWTVPPADFDRVLRTNVRGVWLGARAAIPLMERGSTIVVMGSQQSVIVCRGNAAYATSKAAALQLARAMALDLAPKGIRVNALCPGVCETPLTRNAIERDADPAAFEAELQALSPLGRFGTAEEIAGHVLFLASEQSSFITGAGLMADGGTSIR